MQRIEAESAACLAVLLLPRDTAVDCGVGGPAHYFQYDLMLAFQEAVRWPPPLLEQTNRATISLATLQPPAAYRGFAFCLAGNAEGVHIASESCGMSDPPAKYASPACSGVWPSVTIRA